MGRGNSLVARAKTLTQLVQETITEGLQDRVPRLGAALAYYSVFSIAPLVILVIAVASLVFDRQTVQQAIEEQLRGTLGVEFARAIDNLLHSARSSGSTTLATVLGVLILLFGASGVFGELQDALNTIWKVQPKPGRAVWTILKERFLSFTMVVGTGFLLLVSLVISTGLAALGRFLNEAALPGGVTLWQAVNWAVSLGFIALVFALIYKLVPDVKVAWRDVWIGAVVTALLFDLGKYLLGVYLGLDSTTSAYGAAGSLVVVLLWVYYSSQILLFGAEFTRVYARKFGPRVVAADYAVPVTREALARQGMPRQADVEAIARRLDQPAPGAAVAAPGADAGGPR